MSIFKTLFIGNNAKGRMSNRVFQENKAYQIFRKTNISYPWYAHVPESLFEIKLQACATLACFVFLKHPFWDLPFRLITDIFRYKRTEWSCFKISNIKYNTSLPSIYCNAIGSQADCESSSWAQVSQSDSKVGSWHETAESVRPMCASVGSRNRWVKQMVVLFSIWKIHYKKWNS